MLEKETHVFDQPRFLLNSVETQVHTKTQQSLPEMHQVYSQRLGVITTKTLLSLESICLQAQPPGLSASVVPSCGFPPVSGLGLSPSFPLHLVLSHQPCIQAKHSQVPDVRNNVGSLRL